MANRTRKICAGLISILLCVLLTACASLGPNEKPVGVQPPIAGLEWGMTQSEVEAALTAAGIEYGVAQPGWLDIEEYAQPVFGANCGYSAQYMAYSGYSLMPAISLRFTSAFSYAGEDVEPVLETVIVNAANDDIDGLLKKLTQITGLTIEEKAQGDPLAALFGEQATHYWLEDSRAYVREEWELSDKVLAYLCKIGLRTTPEEIGTREEVLSLLDRYGFSYYLENRISPNIYPSIAVTNRQIKTEDGELMPTYATVVLHAGATVLDVTKTDVN